MIDKRIYITAIIILFCCTVFLYYRLSTYCNQTKNENIDAFQQDNDILLKQKEYIFYESIDRSLVGTNVYWGKAGKILPIAALTDSARLIFRYDLTLCTPCIQTTLDAIRQVFSDYTQNDRIILSCKGLENRLKSLFYNKINLSFLPDSLPIPLENAHVPYLFILDIYLIIKPLFIISKEQQNNLIQYLNMIKKRYLVI